MSFAGHPDSRRIVAFVLLLAAVLVGVCGCAHQTAIGATSKQYLWQSGDQFVALVPSEHLPDSAPNDQPVSLDRERLGAVLAALEWQEAADAKPVKLLTDYEASLLAEQIVNGLARATPLEDLTFALVGNHPAFMGLAKRPQVTTGRIFFSQGRLHLILGMAHEELGRNDDRRLHPFVPGSRERLAELGGTALVAQAVGEKRRADWLVLNPAAAIPSVQPAEVRTPVPAVQVVPLASPVLEGGTLQQPPPDAAKRIEERLLLLKGLKEKGLITDDEYRAKRREILDAL